MSESLLVQEEFVIPEEYNDYKYVVFIAKTTSQKYEFILYTIRKQSNIEITIKNKLWHIVGFKDTVDDFINFANLLQYSEGLKNIHIYKDKILVSNINYKIQNILDCLQNTQKIKNTNLYCNEISKKLKDKFDNPWIIKSSFEFVIKTTEEKNINIQEIKGAEQIFPCHKINNDYFNPYDYKESELQDMYLTYALKKDPYTVNLCPLFDITKYSCKFVDETVVAQ